MTSKFPIRSREHETDDRALAAFNSQRRAAWIVQESNKDYGWDLLVTVPTSEGGVRGDSFFVQMKGSESPNYLADGTYLSQELEVTTLNYLLAQNSPSMLAVCDVAKPNKPIYWVWIDDAIADLEERNPQWCRSPA